MQTAQPRDPPAASILLGSGNAPGAPRTAQAMTQPPNHDLPAQDGAPGAGAAPRLPRAWYAAELEVFVRAEPSFVLGALAANAETEIVQEQRDAWREEIEVLQSALAGRTGLVCLEYNIPRMGRRADAVVLTGGAVWVLEFKTGPSGVAAAPRAEDLEQVWDYALDLKNFHAGSHRATVIPIVVYGGTGPPAKSSAEPAAESWIRDHDGVYRPVAIAAGDLRAVFAGSPPAPPIAALDAGAWLEAAYQPTPTIIEAARALYARHSVASIARSDAGAKNLHVTSERIVHLARAAMRQKEKTICFVTGVPGAGKTLVGLNLATQRVTAGGADPNAVFLSGNGPLVAVLREALAHDEWLRARARGQTVRKGRVRKNVEAFIQNVHHFRDEGLRDPRPPAERMVIFDEAQRAWDLRKTADFMRRRKRQADFRRSEPEFLISCMDRHEDWAVIVCLVGAGQEINTGEAGIQEWLRALAGFPRWQAYVSAQLAETEPGAREPMERLRADGRLQDDEALHLAVSMRSFRAEHMSAFVQAALELDEGSARAALARLARYPIVLTRNLDAAKRWVRQQARGSDRYGLLASSKAQRLKPHAIDVRVDINPVHWFLHGREDTRSSYYLEDAATEFQVQGLELDWACVTWDGDLRRSGAGWEFHDFRGKRWTTVRQEENRRYLLNAYRVLLTRARQGLAIFVPPGDAGDPTRRPEFYDPTFRYLEALGLPVLAD